MKINRSTKCTTKYLTEHKKVVLADILAEYGSCVNQFIQRFWGSTLPHNNELLKPIVDYPDTWLSARLRKVAAREAIAMVKASVERDGDKAIMPTHKRTSMCVSSTIATLKTAKKAISYDAWLELRCIGRGISIDIPIKFHKHYLKLGSMGTRLNSYVVTMESIQFCFEVDTGPKKPGKIAVGVDTGINALATLSTGERFGNDIKDCIDRVKRCRGNGQLRARRALKQRIDEVAKELILKDADLIVVEKLKGLGHNSKVKRRLTKNMRCSIGAWNWKYWLKRVQYACELNRVSFRSVHPQYTSQACHACGYTDRGNRNGEMFRCLKCGHKDNADVNAANNILKRFLTGPYGAGYKPMEEISIL